MNTAMALLVVALVLAVALLLRRQAEADVAELARELRPDVAEARRKLVELDGELGAAMQETRDVRQDLFARERALYEELRRGYEGLKREAREREQALKPLVRAEVEELERRLTAIAGLMETGVPLEKAVRTVGAGAGR